jgi:subtilisin family serine protease
VSWPTRVVLAVLAAVVALSTLSSGSFAPALSGAAQEEAPASGEEVIVVLEEGADPVATAQELGVEPTHIYEDIFTGFAATMPAAAVQEARSSGVVEQISRDGRVQAEDQVVGTGVLRVGVPHTTGSQNLDITSPVDADIAILDTGITGGGDLVVAGGKSCVNERNTKDKKDKKHKKHKKHKNKKGTKHGGKKEKKGGIGKKLAARRAHSPLLPLDGRPKGNNHKKSNNRKNHGKDNNHKKHNKDHGHKTHKKKGNTGNSWKDDNGHGTHVAGIAAAIDNGQGMVGVAPGARVWAVKVLDETGGGSFSDVICGLNWVVQASGTIDVVNLSLSGAGNDGSCASTALHQAICNVVDAGIPVVVAAGNQGTDASTRVPANFNEVITVSAMADSNGEPSPPPGPATCSGEADDTFLSYSNYGEDVDIAAPGDCIASLWKDGKVRRQSGTSSASPHVAGAVAHFISSNGSRPSPKEVRDWLLSDEASKRQDSDVGFSGDPDTTPERMLWLREALGG